MAVLLVVFALMFYGACIAASATIHVAWKRRHVTVDDVFYLCMTVPVIACGIAVLLGYLEACR